LTLSPAANFLSSADVVSFWAEGLYGGGVRDLWKALDPELRLAIAQAYILRSDGPPDDRAATALAARDSQDWHFKKMITEVSWSWRRVYVGLSDGVVFPEEAMRVGADMEHVAAYGREGAGSAQTGEWAKPHSFITRYNDGYGWLIVATGRKLPIPGWPPTEWTIPQLRKIPG